MYRSETQTALNKNILYFIRWTAISIVMGTVCGLIGTAFGYGVIYAQRLFKTHSFMLYLMPVAGVLIVLLHQMFHELGCLFCISGNAEKFPGTQKDTNVRMIVNGIYF